MRAGFRTRSGEFLVLCWSQDEDSLQDQDVLDVHLGVQGVFLDELAAGFD